MTSGEARAFNSVFVVSEAGSDLSSLFDALAQLGLRTLNFDPTSIRVASTLDFIAEADFVCAVLRDVNSPNVYLDLGYALGLGRPVVIIGETSTMPFDLSEQFWIKAPLADTTALLFQLRAFLANPPSKKSKRKSKTSTTAKRSRQPDLLSVGEPGSALEKEILAALQSASEIQSVVPQPHQVGVGGYIPDFAVWLDAPSKLIESPVVIEVKGAHFHGHGIEDSVARIETFARTGDIRTALLITSEQQPKPVRVARLLPLIFVLTIEEFKALLASQTLVDTLVSERNRFAHSAS